jgi:hypothetical protein
VFDGMAILNILRSQPAEVAADVLGLAASAASVVIMAASRGQLRVAKGAMLMIHNSAALVMGNKNHMIEMAELLDKVDGEIASTYALRSGKAAKSWMEAMAAETWYTAEEAVKAGLADEVMPVEDRPPANHWDPAVFAGYKRTPPAVREQFDKAAVAARLRKIEADQVIERLAQIDADGEHLAAEEIAATRARVNRTLANGRRF